MSRPLYALLVTALLASAVVGAGGCASENLQDLSGSDVLACDTSAVATYSAVIRPLIQRNGCLDCHAAGGLGTAATGFNYETAAGLQAANRAGRLIGAIERRTGFSPMPKDRPQISACDIARIKQWVRRGAPND
jgi:mono/diheme cytochrome c family protein